MRRSFVSLCATAVASLILSSAVVRADNIPWGYNASSTSIDNNGGGIKTSSIAFNGAIGGATGDSGIIIYNLKTSSSAEIESPDSFTNVQFDLAITLTDLKATGADPKVKQVVSDTVKFSGQFNADKVTKASLLPGVTNWLTPTKAEVTLGSEDTGWRKYTVDISSFTSPGQPGDAPGSIQAIVRITPGTPPDGGGDPPPETPEPASLVLAGLGLPFILLARRRMKKAQQAEAAL